MSLPNGTRLGPYEITGTLGVGGMGEVYRGKDTRLGREVAVKVLPETVAANAEALGRFEREARAVAALSHPNILAIHDFGVEEGTAYAVTELLEGETLRRRLDGSPLPVRKVLDYGSQIALGLAAAHDKGVIHRDLKPENIIITHDGRAKILDFGLAKLEVAQADDSTASPTVDAGTRPGTVMGTMGYMSPEQLRGQEVDARTDIFSFGSVLYEMITGRKAFWHEAAADTMSAILKEDPPSLSGSGMEIPPSLQQIVHHCLEKNPAERFQSARDLAFHLEAVGSVSASGSQVLEAAGFDPAPSRRSLRSMGLAVAGFALGLVLGAVLAVQLWVPEPSDPPSIRYLSYSGKDSEPSASRDGRLIVYTSIHQGRSQIWLKQFPGGDEVALTDGPDDSEPRISPDGSQVLFTRFSDAGPSLYRIPVVGGDPRKIVDNAYDGDWAPDGDEVAFIRDRVENGELTVVLGATDVSGQASREITTAKLATLQFPRWSPDGETIAVDKAGIENAPHTILLVPSGGGEARTLTPPPPRGRISSPAWTGDGSALLYAEAGSVIALDDGSGRVIRQEIESGHSRIMMWLPVMANKLDLLGDGGVVMGVTSSRQNLIEVSLSGGQKGAEARWLTRGNSTDRQPVFSPDGQWLLFSSNRGGNLDLWKMEMETGAIRRITEDGADDWDPAFTPDGESILWSSNRSGHFEIWICAADGTGARQLTQDGFDAENPTSTRDGEWVVHNSANPEGPGIWKIHPDGTGAELIVPGTWSTPDVSPDGRSVAFRMGAEPRTVHVVRVEDGRQVVPPMDVPGSIFNGRPRWMPDGRSLLFTGNDETGARGIYIQEIVPGQDSIATRRPLLEFVLEQQPESFAISPDGMRMVYSAADRLDSLMLAEGLTGVEPARKGSR